MNAETKCLLKLKTLFISKRNNALGLNAGEAFKFIAYCIPE
jgi:hypothetical protein